MIKTVGIVIPVFNKLFYTKRLLETIAEQKYTQCENLVICVVDNCSTDGTPEYLLKWVSEDSDKRLVLTNKENLGFAPACNVGAGAIFMMAPAADILIMNNDMEMLENCVDELIKAAYLSPDTGIVGGKLLFPDGTIQHGGAFLNVFGWGQHKRARYNDALQTDPEFLEESEYVSGALFYVKNELIKKIGMFDEQFSPAYFEEVDYCFTARAHGYKTIYNPAARAIHYETVTAKEVYKTEQGVNKVSQTNQVKFYLKHDTDIFPPTSEHKILIAGKIYGQWSFCGVMRNFVKGLHRNGVDVAIAPEEYHEPGNMEDWEIKQLINKPKDYWNRHVLRSSEGDHLYLMPPAGGKRIAHTTGESNRISEGWRVQLNHVDQVLTNSSFFRDVMVNNGVTTPIDIVPNSVDMSIFRRDVPAQKIDGLRGFNFFSVFHYGVRKAPETLIKAFVQEFSPEDDVTLTIHSLSMEWVLSHQGKTVGSWISELTNSKPRAPILITTDPMMDTSLGKFYKNFDVFLLPSRGEGFGNPVVEAAAMGIPSIATGYSGLTDFLTEDVGWKIDYKLVDIPLLILPYFKNYVGGQWAEPDVAHLQALMRYTYNNRDEVRAKGHKAYQKAQEYSIENVGKIAKRVIFEK